MKTLLFVSSCFVFFLASCSRYFNVSQENDFANLQKNKYVDVLYVKTGLPDTFFFSKKYPGKLYNEKVSGVRQVSLNLLDPDSIVYEKSSRSIKILYAVKDGIKYGVFVENNRNYAYNLQQVTQVPFSDIHKMYVRVYRPVYLLSLLY